MGIALQLTDYKALCIGSLSFPSPARTSFFSQLIIATVRLYCVAFVTFRHVNFQGGNKKRNGGWDATNPSYAYALDFNPFPALLFSLSELEDDLKEGCVTEKVGNNNF